MPPLALPGDGDPALLVESEAVQLFASRARDIDPGFVLDAESAVVIGEIVTRLDGLPLAIELAAARTRLLRSMGRSPFFLGYRLCHYSRRGIRPLVSRITRDERSRNGAICKGGLA